MLKSKRYLKLISITGFLLIVFVIGFFKVSGVLWKRWDFQAQDFFYKEAVKRGHGPKSSSRIKYLAINNGTYQYFDKNNLDRRDLAKINQVLVDLSPQAVFYDIIFKRRTEAEADQIFEQSVRELGVVYLPMGFSLVDEPREFKREKGFAYQRLEKMLEIQPIEKGSSQPYHATQSNMHLQYDGFAKAAFNSGHISSPSDSDGVYRHHPLVIKVNNKLLPSISLSIFLDYAQVSFDEVEINWGKKIRIPATRESFLDEDVIVPIDERGRVYIPFAHFWEGEFPQGNDFEKMTVQSLLKHSENRNMSGNLAEFFEGNFVFIADFSTGISDTGTTQLEKMVPLVSVHANLVNSFLTNTFYSKWSFNDFARLIIAIGLFFVLTALLKNSKFLYAAGIVVLAGIIGLIWYQNLRFALVPIVSLITGSLIIFVGIVTSIQLLAAKEKAFIQKAFSKYLSPVLVKGLLENPELLKVRRS